MHLKNTGNINRERWHCGRNGFCVETVSCVKKVCRCLVMLMCGFFPMMKTGSTDLDLWITVVISYG